MTNAHVVSDASYVSVKRHGSGTKFRADVVAVGHECDLALLSVPVNAANSFHAVCYQYCCIYLHPFLRHQVLR